MLQSWSLVKGGGHLEHGQTVCNLWEAAGDRPFGQPLGRQDEAAVLAEPAARSGIGRRRTAEAGGVHDLPAVGAGAETEIPQPRRRALAFDFLQLPVP